LQESKSVTPYGDSVSKKAQVEEMFDNIAGRYDFLNHLLSINIDKLWRKKAIKILRPKKPEYILDVATGTADFAIECVALNPKEIIGIDLSAKMLAVGKVKVSDKNLEDLIALEKGDSENLPYKDNRFDAITVGFGVRNFENLKKGLSEMLRVLKPGGTLAVLEFSKPRVFPVKQLFSFYFHYVCPLIGKVFSKDDRAYTYLPESVESFPEGAVFASILEEVGFKAVQCKSLTFGISSIYIGEKP